MSERSTQAADLVMVGAAMVIGLALCLVKLPGMGLWYDELISVTLADRPFPAWLYSALVYEPHPPLFTFLLHVWLRLGRSDLLILFLPVLTGVATIPALFLASRHLLGSRAAATGALLLALHPLALYWSHHARMYAPLTLFAVLALASNVAYLSRQSRLVGAGVIAAQQAVIWIHMAGWFCVGFVILAVAFEARRQGWPIVAWRRLQLLSLAMGLPALLTPLLRGRLGHMSEPGPAEVTGALAQLVRGPMPVSMVWTGLAAGLFGLGTALLVTRAKTRPLALSLLVLPLLAAFVVSHALRPMWYAPRTFAFMVPF